MSRAMALAACAIATLLPFAAACGDGAGDTPAPAGGSTATVEVTNPGVSPDLSPPASKYVIRVEDLGTNWITDIPATVVVDAAGYAQTKVFPSQAEGEKLLSQWGYEGGYQTGYSPEGRDTAVLNGAYYIRTECHLFAQEAGAKQAYDYFNRFAAAQPGMAPVTMTRVGNQSAAYVMTLGTIGKSSVNAVYHQVLFQRGNLVCVVLTKGAEPFMKVDAARELALISDKKALGQLDAPEPTPTSNYNPSAGN
ncbi:hypothetical protein [Tepidiforma sp.]|uniref:hypothetical protein n=1 Tax=Tepidiforma sp. TaxID=2682230 RepID=UPI002623005C|nr:hypothetical protein [Tepidiforma sp.]MCX7617960.1 hypothetical protein [Tepidiforma sp.]